MRRGERRQATVLFADLCDYTALSEGVDPEEVAVVMERIKDAASRSIQGQGGLINQFLGDGVVALFGIPVANEDDSRRAIDAALELHRAVRAISTEFEAALGRPLRVHSSVHRGLLVAKSRDVRDGVYGVTGDTINTAARILSHAGPDEIVVSRSTFEPVEAFFGIRLQWR
jgi:class 3 adenylate cyclase